MLQESNNKDGLDLFLHHFGDSLINPDGYVWQNLSVGRKIKISKTMTILLWGGLGLKKN